MTACLKFVAKLETVPFPAAETAICRLCGIPENSITRWREGRKIHLDHAFRLARQLGVSLDWLADDDREQPPGQEMSAEMRKVMELVEYLGPAVAMARLTQKPGPPEAGTVHRHNPDPDPRPKPKPKSRPNQARARTGSGAQGQHRP